MRSTLCGLLVLTALACADAQSAPGQAQPQGQDAVVAEVADRAGVTPATLKRWVGKGIIPGGKRATGNGWTPAAAAHARVVARLRARSAAAKK